MHDDNQTPSAAPAACVLDRRVVRRVFRAVRYALAAGIAVVSAHRAVSWLQQIAAGRLLLAIVLTVLVVYILALIWQLSEDVQDVDGNA